MMDIDYDFGPAKGSSSSQGVRTSAAEPVLLEDASVFSLSDYADYYSGRRKIQRLMFIGRSCPQLSLEAFRLAADSIKADTMDVGLYEEAVNGYQLALNAGHSESEGHSLKRDDQWIADMRRTAQKESDKLEVELKSYQSNLIKESIRMAFRDLGNFNQKTGHLQSAIRYHTKCRDHCSIPAHVIDMCLSCIDIAIEMCNYTYVRNHAMKAETAIDAAGRGASLSSSSGGGSTSSGPSKQQTRGVHLPGMVAPQATKEEEARSKERQLLTDKLNLASGLADLGSGYYERAASSLLNLSAPSLKAAQEAGELYVSTGDIAMYTVLCGLASFDRAALKTSLHNNANLRSLLETEPHLKTLLNAFYENKYATVLQVLQKHAPRHLLDVHLSPHVPALVSAIQDRAVVAFAQPFSSVSLSRMATVFGWSEEDTKQHVLRLIQKGSLAARIDSQAGVVKAHQPDVRRDLYEKALAVGQQVDEATKKVQLRMKLLQHDLIVKDSARGLGGGPRPGQARTMPMAEDGSE